MIRTQAVHTLRARRAPPKTVLIVEDNELNMKLLHDVLEAHGYATLTAREGMAAIALARAHRPDLILMDLQLPDVSGYDAVRELKAGSSLWVHKTYPELESFAWQTGYGAFTVSQSQVGVVHRYIANQEAHHRAVTFQDEFRELLRRHGVEWDERYVWD